MLLSMCDAREHTYFPVTMVAASTQHGGACKLTGTQMYNIRTTYDTTIDIRYYTIIRVRMILLLILISLLLSVGSDMIYDRCEATLRTQELHSLAAGVVRVRWSLPTALPTALDDCGHDAPTWTHWSMGTTVQADTRPSARELLSSEQSFASRAR